MPGLTEADVLAQWSADERSVLVYRRAEIPARLERVDLATGNRTLFKEFAPADRTGLLSMREIFVTDDLRSYAYSLLPGVEPVRVGGQAMICAGVAKSFLGDCDYFRAKTSCESAPVWRHYGRYDYQSLAEVHHDRGIDADKKARKTNSGV